MVGLRELIASQCAHFADSQHAQKCSGLCFAGLVDNVHFNCSGDVALAPVYHGELALCLWACMLQHAVVDDCVNMTLKVLTVATIDTGESPSHCLGTLTFQSAPPLHSVHHAWYHTHVLLVDPQPKVPDMDIPKPFYRFFLNAKNQGSSSSFSVVMHRSCRTLACSGLPTSHVSFTMQTSN